MGRLLLIGEEEREKLHALRKHAESNVFSFDDMLDIKNNAEPPAGDRDGFSCIIPDDFRVVFSHEMHPPNMLVLRHVSISVPVIGRLPNPAACLMIMHELGFRASKFEDCDAIYFDDQENPRSINILELVNNILELVNP